MGNIDMIEVTRKLKCRPRFVALESPDDIWAIGNGVVDLDIHTGIGQHSRKQKRRIALMGRRARNVYQLPEILGYPVDRYS